MYTVSPCIMLSPASQGNRPFSTQNRHQFSETSHPSILLLLFWLPEAGPKNPGLPNCGLNLTGFAKLKNVGKRLRPHFAKLDPSPNPRPPLGLNSDLVVAVEAMMEPGIRAPQSDTVKSRCLHVALPALNKRLTKIIQNSSGLGHRFWPHLIAKNVVIYLGIPRASKPECPQSRPKEALRA